MRRGGDAPERDSRAQPDVDRQLAQRMLLQKLTLQSVAVTIATASLRQHLRVADLDSLARQWRNGEHARLEDVAARPFQQPRIAALAQDGLVDLPRPLLLDDIRF